MNRDIEKEEELFQKRRENNIRLRKAIEVDQSIFKDKIRENDELLTKINFLKIDHASKIDILTSKKKMCHELSENEKKYKVLFIFFLA